jgi:probable addiction module antidote protein
MGTNTKGQKMNEDSQLMLKPFDPADYLDNPRTIAFYLAEAAEDSDPGAFLSALADVARARGMTDIARQTGMSRQSLYKALAHDANPHYSTLRKVMDSLGVVFTTQIKPASLTQKRVAAASKRANPRNTKRKI